MGSHIRKAMQKPVEKQDKDLLFRYDKDKAVLE